MVEANKKRQKILLISVTDNLSVIGIKQIHYCLLKDGWQSRHLYITSFDKNNFYALKNLQDFISQITPLFIGISLMSIEYNYARNLTVFLKKKFPAIPILWGGIHPTIDPNSCFPFADYVCIGEGEKSILDFSNAVARGDDPREIRNLCYQEKEQLNKNPLYPLIDKLDSLPWIDHVPKHSLMQKKNGEISLIDRNLYKKKAGFQGKRYNIFTSRGCNFSCTFCCNNFFTKIYPEYRKIRRRSVESIIAELEYALKRNPDISIVKFQDDAFLSCSKEYLGDFCQAYKTKINKPFALNTIPIYVNRDKLRLLKEAGLCWINMGFQTGSDRVNRDIYKRRVYKKDFLRIAELIKEFNFAGKYDIILDNPYESENETIKTIETLIETPKPYLIEFFSLTLFPGTELYDRVKKECPEKMEDCREKHYMHYERTTLNKLVVLAVYLPETVMKKIIQLYKVDSGKGASFKATFFIFNILSLTYYRPKIFFNMLKLSHRGSYVKTLLSIPMFLKEILYIKNM